MHRFQYTLLLTAFLLSSCGRPTLVLDVKYLTDEKDLVTHLRIASENVIERMAFALEQEIPEISAKEHGDGIRMTIGLENESTAASLAEGITRPLDLTFAVEAQEGETPYISNEQYGSFVLAELKGEHITWVSVEGSQHESIGGTGEMSTSISMAISEEGQKVWESMQKTYNGRKMGLFARGGLVSITTIEDKDSNGLFTISGIPSFELAKVFADDVNVGRYAVFEVVE